MKCLNSYDLQQYLVVKFRQTQHQVYLYNGWNLIQETIQNQQSTITNSYVWGKDLSGTLQGAGGVGGLLATCIDDEWYFPLYDNNGNVLAYVDSTGNIVAEYAYDAFGNTISQSGSLASTFAHRFSTKYYNRETGLYYYGYRFYDPILMRWLNRDPIEEQGGLNLYGFVGNNAVSQWDRLGLFDKKTFMLVASITTFDHTMCPEFSGDGGTIEKYKKLFSINASTGRLKMLTVPTSIRSQLASSMVIAPNMEENHYYDLTMKLNYWKKEECRNVGKNLCPSGMQKVIHHIIEMESPSDDFSGYVKQYNDKEGKIGENVVTPFLPVWVGPVITYECVR